MTAGTWPPRVVVTGIGVVSPIGVGTDAFWANLSSAKGAIGPITSFSAEGLHSKFAAEVRDFNPEEHIYHKKFLKVMSRDIQLGVAAASFAMRDSGISKGSMDPERLGVEFGAGHISTTPEELADAARSLGTAGTVSDFGEEDMGHICPLWLLKQLPNMPACHVAIEHDARGPNNTITSCESSALLALAEAVRTIQRGAADAMIVGACSSYLNPLKFARLNAHESLSRQTDPSIACRPFDRDRDGTVAGEGAGAFVIETYEHARQRNARIYAEILGVGAGCDGRDFGNRENGVGLSHAITHAMYQADVTPRDLGHINAHGKGTRRDDLAEARAYHTSLGMIAERIPVTALKSYFGHFDAGAGAVELAGSLLALAYGELPATLGYRNPDPLVRLNVLTDQSLRLHNSVALTCNRTRMGQSAAAVIRAVY